MFRIRRINRIENHIQNVDQTTDMPSLIVTIKQGDIIFANSTDREEPKPSTT